MTSELKKDLIDYMREYDDNQSFLSMHELSSLIGTPRCHTVEVLLNMIAYGRKWSFSSSEKFDFNDAYVVIGWGDVLYSIPDSELENFLLSKADKDEVREWLSGDDARWNEFCELIED